MRDGKLRIGYCFRIISAGGKNRFQNILSRCRRGDIKADIYSVRLVRSLVLINHILRAVGGRCRYGTGGRLPLRPVGDGHTRGTRKKRNAPVDAFVEEGTVIPPISKEQRRCGVVAPRVYPCFASQRIPRASLNSGLNFTGIYKSCYRAWDINIDKIRRDISADRTGTRCTIPRMYRLLISGTAHTLIPVTAFPLRQCGGILMHMVCSTDSKISIGDRLVIIRTGRECSFQYILPCGGGLDSCICGIVPVFFFIRIDNPLCTVSQG